MNILHLALLGLATLSSALPALTPPSPAACILQADTNVNVTARDAVGFHHGKRGIAFNDPAFTRFFDTGNSKVYWMYNWASSVNPSAHATGFDFVPLLHSIRPDHTGPWLHDVDVNIGNCNWNAMSFNEPDQCGNGGACMQDVGVTIAVYQQWIQPLLTKYGPGLKLGAPAVTNGPAPMGLDYLKRFIAGCSGCKIDFVAIHWYDSAQNVDYFKKHIQDAYTASGNRPVWITEFGPTGTDAEKINFLHQVLPWLDNQNYVQRYAMFMATPGELIKLDGSGLSAIGEAFNSY